MYEAGRYYIIMIAEQPIDAPVLCWKCRELGFITKISLRPYINEEGHAKHKPVNYYSHTKHYCMTLSDGTDTFDELDI